VARAQMPEYLYGLGIIFIYLLEGK